MHFTDRHLKAFQELSHDKSPIHWNCDYARRTPLGSPVVYGVAAVLFGLGLWAQGRAFALRRISGRFRRALYINVEYDYRFKETGNKVDVRLMRKDSTLMEFSFEWELWKGGAGNDGAATTGARFHPLTEANEETAVPADDRDVAYSCNLDALEAFDACYPLHSTQLPHSQLQTLLWSSYQVGMIWPGAQALYTSFDLRFHTGATHCGPVLSLDKLSYRFDDRFDMATIASSSDSMGIELTAFLRPKPVDYSLDSISAVVAKNDSLEGKNVLVLGASRGFGAVLSCAFLLKGANVAINFRTQDKALQSLREQLSPYEERLFLVQGDISEPQSCEKIRLAVEENLGRLDYMVCNASPPIMAYPFAELETEEFTSFVDRSITLCHRPFAGLRPILNDKATVINISSVYASRPPRNFSHYVTAKWAIEGMTHALASEYPDMRFVLARLPRMLTDQTNSNLDFEPKVSAIDVAAKLLDRVLQSGEAANPLLVDFGRED